MKQFLTFLVILAVVAGCEGEESVSLDTGSEYLPFKRGIYQIYMVNETRYSSAGEPEVSEYELMTEVVDSFPGPEGQYTYVIHRSRRSDAGAWEALDTWSARKDKRNCVVSEGNTPFVKVIFPVRAGRRWDGNAFNTLGEDEYELNNIHQPLEIGGMPFEKTLTVEQERNEDVIVYYDARKEVYALDVGLVYREIIQLNYCTDDHCRGQQKIDSGFEMKQVIIQYGKQ